MHRSGTSGIDTVVMDRGRRYTCIGSDRQGLGFYVNEDGIAVPVVQRVRLEELRRMKKYRTSEQ